MVVSVIVAVFLVVVVIVALGPGQSPLSIAQQYSLDADKRTCLFSVTFSHCGGEYCCISDQLFSANFTCKSQLTRGDGANSYWPIEAKSRVTCIAKLSLHMHGRACVLVHSCARKFLST